MRTIDEIFNSMVARKRQIRELDVLTDASAVSIWRLLLYIVAVAINTVEKLFDTHKEEVEAMIKKLVPGRAEWYAHKTTEFLKDELLPEGEDEYDTTWLTDEEIAEKKVVKYAVAYEDRAMANLTIKIAGENNGDLAPLDDDTETQIRAYLEAVKYAGVKINLINRSADDFACELNVWYNPLLTATTVRDACIAAVETYLKNLPFNGEYSNMALVDAVQKVDGVQIADLVKASSNTSKTDEMREITSHIRPLSGYFRLKKTGGRKQITINLEAYE